MMMPSRRSLLRVGLVIAVVALCAAQLVSGQSLADAAREAQAKRKSAKSPAKVYTNDTLKPAPQPSPGSVPSGEGQTAQAAPPTTTPTPGGGGSAQADPGQNDEAAWRKRIADARDALQRAEAFQAALESQINGLTTDFVNRDDPIQRSGVAAKRDKAMSELERVKKEVQQHAKAIEDIQEEARRAGVPAGWVR
jgi:hypothetical protein